MFNSLSLSEGIILRWSILFGCTGFLWPFLFLSFGIEVLITWWCSCWNWDVHSAAVWYRLVFMEWLFGCTYGEVNGFLLYCFHGAIAINYHDVDELENLEFGCSLYLVNVGLSCCIACSFQLTWYPFHNWTCNNFVTCVLFKPTSVTSHLPLIMSLWDWLDVIDLA